MIYFAITAIVGNAVAYLFKINFLYTMVWHAHVTVAAVIPREGRFLMVKERSPDGQIVINQPAGHLDPGETLLDACRRETLEETRWQVEPQAILSLNLYNSPHNGITYFRCNFLATPLQEDSNATLDKEIELALWMSEAEILAQKHMLRSPLVWRAIEDFNSGTRYPLTMLHHFIGNE